MGTEAIPFIDPNVEHVGVSKLRKLNSAELRNIKKTMVLQENGAPLAVLLKYEQFLMIQNQLRSLLATIELLTDSEESAALVAGLKDVAAGRTKSFAEITASLKKRSRRFSTKP